MDVSALETRRGRIRPWGRHACCAVLLCICDWAAAGEAAALCEFEAVPEHPMANRSGTISALEHLPESCLKTLLLECSESANQQLMDLGSAAMCSMTYEALLKKGFGGSFHAFMEWWRQERDQGRAY
jgi:hypothetical protein